jgi:hypothetical protein
MLAAFESPRQDVETDRVLQVKVTTEDSPGVDAVENETESEVVIRMFSVT